MLAKIVDWLIKLSWWLPGASIKFSKINPGLVTAKVFFIRFKSVFSPNRTTLGARYVPGNSSRGLMAKQELLYTKFL
jgi:hypothetical protein